MRVRARRVELSGESFNAGFGASIDRLAHYPQRTRGGRRMRLNHPMRMDKAFRKHLARASAHTARRALDSIGSVIDTDIASATLSAGVAVEYCLRAVVATVSPALLFMPRAAFNAQTLVRAVEGPAVDHTWILKQTSTEFSKISQLAFAAVPRLSHLSESVEIIQKRRNSVAHMHSVEAGTLRDTLTVLVQVVDASLARLKLDEEEFWGERRVSLVRQLQEEGVEKDRHDVAVWLHQAQTSYQARIESVPFPERATIIAALEGAESPWSQPGPVQVFRENCPACGSRARITIRCADELFSIDELEVAEWEDGVPTGFFVPQLAVTASLYCPVCQLHLAYSSLQIAAPELADLDRYTLVARKITQQEHDQLMWSYAPDEDGLQRWSRASAVDGPGFECSGCSGEERSCLDHLVRLFSDPLRKRGVRASPFTLSRS